MSQFVVSPHGRRVFATAAIIAALAIGAPGNAQDAGRAIGAATGGGAGTGVVLATKGEEIHYDPETRLDFTVANSIEL